MEDGRRCWCSLCKLIDLKTFLLITSPFCCWLTKQFNTGLSTIQSPVELSLNISLTASLLYLSQNRTNSHTGARGGGNLWVWDGQAKKKEGTGGGTDVCVRNGNYIFQQQTFLWAGKATRWMPDGGDGDSRMVVCGSGCNRLKNKMYGVALHALNRSIECSILGGQ